MLAILGDLHSWREFLSLHKRSSRCLSVKGRNCTSGKEDALFIKTFMGCDKIRSCSLPYRTWIHSYVPIGWSARPGGFGPEFLQGLSTRYLPIFFYLGDTIQSHYYRRRVMENL